MPTRHCHLHTLSGHHIAPYQENTSCYPRKVTYRNLYIIANQDDKTERSHLMIALPNKQEMKLKKKEENLM